MVYLLEPWWNPEVDEQAMDRVHQIGQTKVVTVVRIIARNSIEERILELQNEKKRMVAFQKEKKKRAEMASKALDKKAGHYYFSCVNNSVLNSFLSLHMQYTNCWNIVLQNQ